MLHKIVLHKIKNYKFSKYSLCKANCIQSERTVKNPKAVLCTYLVLNLYCVLCTLNWTFTVYTVLNLYYVLYIHICRTPDGGDWNIRESIQSVTVSPSQNPGLKRNNPSPNPGLEPSNPSPNHGVEPSNPFPNPGLEPRKPTPKSTDLQKLLGIV